MNNLHGRLFSARLANNLLQAESSYDFLHDNGLNLGTPLCFSLFYSYWALDTRHDLLFKTALSDSNWYQKMGDCLETLGGVCLNPIT